MPWAFGLTDLIVINKKSALSGADFLLQVNIFDEKIRLGEFKYEILKFGRFDFNSNTNTCTNDNSNSKYDCQFIINDKNNNDVKKTKVILSDKDMVESNGFKVYFSNHNTNS